MVFRSFAALVAALCMFPGPAAAQDAEAGRVHFLLVVDSLGGNAKALGLDLDGENMQKTIRTALAGSGMAEGPDARFSVKVLEGEAASEQSIFHYYRNLKTTPRKDTLVFYYTGHGGFYLDRGHRLNLRNWQTIPGKGKKAYPAEVDRSDLVAAMARHEPRAIIVLTDCCSSADAVTLSQESRSLKEDEFGDLPRLGAGKGEVARDLFFRAQGVVNITAARTGTPARGDRRKGGSFFTIALAKVLMASAASLDRDGDRLVDWGEAMPALARVTEKESWRPIGLDDKGVKIGEVHTPEWFMLAQPPRADKGDRDEVWKKPDPLPAVEDRLTSADKKISLRKGHASYAKEYAMSLKAGAAYLFRLHSAEFDTYLYVKDASGKVVAVDDDYGGTTRSRLLFAPRADGAYVLGVASYVSDETGAFTLTSQTASYMGELKKGDPLDRFRTGSFRHIHNVRLKAGRAYTFGLEAFSPDDLDTYLRIEDRFGNTLALNDDEDQSNRLNSLIVFRPNFSGTYFVVTSSMLPGRTGRYALFIRD